MNEDSKDKKMGRLYVVATPLGNLEDMSFRAVRTLNEVELIAAEDTRRTQKLLSHYCITTRMVSYREQNHARVLPMLLSVLENGGDLAQVSDAGTPGVSDPGVLLAREAAAMGARVIPIPGPSAAACLLSVCGLPADSYLFAGFLPAKAKARREILKSLADETRTLVFFEAPHRLEDSVREMKECLGDRRVVLGREMTKLNEEFISGTLGELHAEMVRRGADIKGEATLAVAGADPAAGRDLSREELWEIVSKDTRPVRDIVAELAGSTRLSRSELYRLVLEATGKS